MTDRAMKSGAVEFLTESFRDQDLLDAIYQALDRDRDSREPLPATPAATALLLPMESGYRLAWPELSLPLIISFLAATELSKGEDLYQSFLF